MLSLIYNCVITIIYCNYIKKILTVQYNLGNSKFDFFVVRTQNYSFIEMLGLEIGLGSIYFFILEWILIRNDLVFLVQVN